MRSRKTRLNTGQKIYREQGNRLRPPGFYEFPLSFYRRTESSESSTCARERADVQQLYVTATGVRAVSVARERGCTGAWPAASDVSRRESSGSVPIGDDFFSSRLAPLRPLLPLAADPSRLYADRRRPADDGGRPRGRDRPRAHDHRGGVVRSPRR